MRCGPTGWVLRWCAEHKQLTYGLMDDAENGWDMLREVLDLSVQTGTGRGGELTHGQEADAFCTS